MVIYYHLLVVADHHLVYNNQYLVFHEVNMLEKLLGNKSAYWVMLYLYHYGEVYPTLIADSLQTSLNPIKGQLKKLSDAGILSRKKMGKMNLYFFNEKAAIVKPLKEMIAIEYDNINQADKNKLFNHRARSRREGKPVIS